MSTTTDKAPDAPTGRKDQVPNARNRIFIPAAAFVLVFVVFAAIFPSQLKTALGAANTTVVDGLGWYYVIIVFGFVAFSIFTAFSRFGDIRLGKDDEKPQYGMFSWFAMLFAAGMGIGLVFWGVAEPLNHFNTTPPGAADVANAGGAARQAFDTTFLHWGLHAWAIYIVIGLAVAYAVHRKGRSVSIRWILEPLFGDKIKGRVGDLIDIVAIVGTLFGVATSLGFGVTQFTAGLEYLNVIEGSIGWIILFVAVITALATLSVVSGLDFGIKILSNGNLILAGLLMLLVLLLGSPLFVMREFVQNIGHYIQNFLQLSFRTMPFQGEEGATWLGGWTTYYWGWWMSWSPFVGVFIARISRGRTIREFILGVMLVPTMITMLWFSVMGGTAIWQQINGDNNFISAEGTVSTNDALFQMLSVIPGGPILSGLFLILIVVFFVTSSDSASFVVDMLASGGNPNPPVLSRVFWAVMEGAIAAVLLFVGSRSGNMTDGLQALQTMAILVAAPFSVVMVLTVVATLKELRQEHQRIVDLETKVLHREIALEAAELESGTTYK